MQPQNQDQGFSTAASLLTGVVIGSVVTELFSNNHYGWGPYNHPVLPAHVQQWNQNHLHDQTNIQKNRPAPQRQIERAGPRAGGHFGGGEHRGRR